MQENSKRPEERRQKIGKTSLRLNTTVYGQPAVWAKELKDEGVIRNNADLICQAISALYERFVNERLKILRLKTLEENKEDNDL